MILVVLFVLSIAMFALGLLAMFYSEYCWWENVAYLLETYSPLVCAVSATIAILTGAIAIICVIASAIA